MEFFVADDIIQGEKVPFFLLWDQEEPKEISIKCSGFEKIIELHNADESSINNQNCCADINKTFVNGYLGGLLLTSLTESPVNEAEITISMKFENGDILELNERRNLFTTAIELPEEITDITLSNDRKIQPILLDLKGNTTVVFEIEELDGNEVDIDIPPEIKESILEIEDNIRKGIKELKKMYPDYQDLLDIMLMVDADKKTMSNYIEEIEEKYTNNPIDESFAEDLTMLFITSIMKNSGFKSRFLQPMNEYFTAYSAEKAYFSNPLLHANIIEGRQKVALNLVTKNIINQECAKPLKIVFEISSDDNYSIQIKDFFSMRRIKNDS